MNHDESQAGLFNMPALSLANGGDKLNRKASDYYPTPSEVTHALMKFLYDQFWFDDQLSIHEPACGNGAMSEVIKQYGNPVFSSDIRQTGYGQEEIDFLLPHNNFGCDVIITNPPFNLSKKFIEIACSRSKIVCLLLKSQYWHAKGRYSLFVKHPPSYVLPLTWRPDFLNGERGGAPTMECIWTVWRKGITDYCIYQPLLKPEKS